MEIGFSLGSNMGDRLTALRTAKKSVLDQPGTAYRTQSSIYETEPVGVRDAYKEASFLNAVLVIESPDHPRTWLGRLRAIEFDMGRRRTADRFAPRPIDIDILYGGDSWFDDGGLTVPHPRWAVRRFVVQPLSDVRPSLILPGAAKTVREILQSLPSDEKVVLRNDVW